MAIILSDLNRFTIFSPEDFFQLKNKFGKSVKI